MHVRWIIRLLIDQANKKKLIGWLLNFVEFDTEFTEINGTESQVITVHKIMVMEFNLSFHTWL